MTASSVQNMSKRAVVQLVPLCLSSSSATLLLLLAIGIEVVLARDVALRATFLDVFGLGYSVLVDPGDIAKVGQRRVHIVTRALSRATFADMNSL